MNFEKLVALTLSVSCAFAAVGVWRDRAQDAPRGGAMPGAAAPSLSRAWAAPTADLVVLSVDGMILEGDGGGGLSGGKASSRSLTKAIARLREDPPKALLIRINSPGGSAAASQAIYDELMRLKREKGVKIVVSMGDVCASGGYMIAAAADRIVANPATLTGSIGVIMHLANYEGLMGKVGVRSVTIKAGRLKDIASPDRTMRPEERRLLQGIVDDTYALFLDAVAKGRGWPLDKVRALAEGRIYTGRQAKELGLVDGLGNFEVAKDEARRVARLPKDTEAEELDGDDWQQLWKLLAVRSDLVSNVARGNPALASRLYDRVPLMLLE
ncbi:MAG: signal peptide peptidase SppA [Candidatus Sericytochromatia bacterium]|nr:signal peptide peptidase SppA [Candidatus Sericytochromatia bacterium]